MEWSRKKVPKPLDGESQDDYARRVAEAAGDRNTLRGWYLEIQSDSWERQALSKAFSMVRSSESKPRRKSKARGRK